MPKPKSKQPAKPKKRSYRYGGRKKTLEDPITLGCMVDRSDREWLNQEAAKLGLSQGKLIRYLIKFYQERHEG